MTGTLSWWWLPVYLTGMTALIAPGVVFYHRILTHKAARISPWVLYPAVLLASPMGTPVGWVGNHRHHHQVTDKVADPHSPGRHGFWVAHAGWYLHTTSTFLSVLYSFAGPFRMVFDAFWRPRTGMDHAHLARDLDEVPFYRWLSRPGPFGAVVITYFVLVYGLGVWLFGPAVLPILYVTNVTYYWLGDGVNSLCHLYGRRPFRSRDESTNLAWLAAFSLGEGFHHNHHVFPTSIRAGLLPGQIDLMYLLCRALERVGLASDLRQPTLPQLLDRVVDPDALRRLEQRAAREGAGGRAPGSAGAPGSLPLKVSPHRKEKDMTDRSEMLVLLQEACRKVLGKEAPLITEELALGTDSIDSLELIEVMIEIEDRLGIRFRDSDFDGVETVGGLVDIFMARLQPVHA